MTSMPDGPLSSLVVVTDPVTREHRPGAEIWVGVRTPGTEVPARVEAILEALTAAGAHVQAPDVDPAELLLRIHSPELLEWLASAAQRWAEGEYAVAVGQDRVVPYVFPTAAMLQGLSARPATATHAEAGRFCYDTMTLIGPGTWEAAVAAAATAATAATVALTGRTAYALSRPPGHHAARDAFGGSCYLNNAAVAATVMREAGLERVAIIDIDAHHGNGTQAIFYSRDDVYYGSVHVDPGRGWFPHFMGFPEERGHGAGQGWNRNIPLAPGSGDDAFLAGLATLCTQASELGAQGLVVSLGVDAAELDPESPLRVSRGGFSAAGRLLAEMELPTALVQEGGYHLETLGVLVADVLGGFA